MAAALNSLKANEKYDVRFCIFVDKSVSKTEQDLLKSLHPNVEIRLLEDWISQQEKICSGDFSSLFESLTSIVTTTIKGKAYAEQVEFDQNPFRFIALRFFYPMIFFGDDDAPQLVMSLDFDKVFNRSHEEALKLALNVDQPVLATPSAMMNFAQVQNRFPFISPVDNFNGGLLIFNKDVWFRTLAWMMPNIFQIKDRLRDSFANVKEIEQQKLAKIFSAQVWPILDHQKPTSSDRRGPTLFSEHYLGLMFLMYCLKSPVKFDENQAEEALLLPLMDPEKQKLALCHILTEERFFFEIVNAYCRCGASQMVYLNGMFNANSQRDQIFRFVRDVKAYLLDRLAQPKKAFEVLFLKEHDAGNGLKTEFITGNQDLLGNFFGEQVQKMINDPILKNYCKRYAEGKVPELFIRGIQFVCESVCCNIALKEDQEQEIVFACKVLKSLVSLLSRPDNFVKRLRYLPPLSNAMKVVCRAVGEAFLSANSPLYLFKDPDKIRASLQSEPLNVHFDQEKKPWAYNLGEELSLDVAEWYEHFQRFYNDLLPEQKDVIKRNCLSVSGIGTGVKAIAGIQ